MRSFNIARFLGAATLTILTGCSSGGGSSTPGTTPASTMVYPMAMATFNDAPVAGLTYATSGGTSAVTTGTTNALGQFPFTPGQTVTFTAEGVPLGTFKPASAKDGSMTITPLSLLPKATGVTDPTVTAMAQFLNTLGSISTALGSTSSGVLVLPVNTALQNQLTALGTTGSTITVSQLQGVLNSVYGAGTYTVIDATDAQSGVQQSVNSVGVSGTTWTGSCACGATTATTGEFYFQPDGTLNGVGYTPTATGTATGPGIWLSGSWGGNNLGSATTAGVNFTLVGSDGTYSTGGFILTGKGTGTAQVYSSTNTLLGTLTLTQVTGTTNQNMQYEGGVYITATSTIKGNNGWAYMVTGPDRSFTGLDNTGNVFSGIWTVGTGQGYLNWANNLEEIGFNFTTGKGSFVMLSDTTPSATKTTTASLAFSNMGWFSVTPPTTNEAAQPIPLELNVVTNWANQTTSTNNVALSIWVHDGAGTVIGMGTKSDVEAPNTTGIPSSTSVVAAVNYSTSKAPLTDTTARYTVSVGTQPCVVTAGGTGTVVDANSGNASAYPTVHITCH